MNNAPLNFRKHPYRGIAQEIAKERGVTTVAIMQQIRNKNPEILEIVLKKAAEREALIERYDAKVSGRLAA